MSIEDYLLKAKKASIVVPKYLLGHDIHKLNKKRRERIRAKENNLAKRVLKLGLNYSYEGVRQTLRYFPLALESWLIYENVTNDYPFSTWGNLLQADLYWRLFEGLMTVSEEGIEACYEFSENMKGHSERVKKAFEDLDETLKKSFENLNRSFEDLNELLNRLNEQASSDPKFRAFLRGNLLSDPYTILGLRKNIGEEEVKKAYRKIAFECHPDKHNGKDEEKTKRFIEATKAYYQLTGKYHKI